MDGHLGGGIPVDASRFPPRPPDGEATEGTNWTVIAWDPRHGLGEVPAPRSPCYTHGYGGAGDTPPVVRTKPQRGQQREARSKTCGGRDHRRVIPNFAGHGRRGWRPPGRALVVAKYRIKGAPTQRPVVVMGSVPSLPPGTRPGTGDRPTFPSNGTSLVGERRRWPVLKGTP